MKDNLKNFREDLNLILKDIYVTDELKIKTLENCTNKRRLKTKPLIATTASVAILIATFTVNYFSHKSPIANNYVNKSINYEYKNPIHSETPKEPSKITDNKDLAKSNYSSLKDKNDSKANIKSENSTSDNKSSKSSTVDVPADTTKQNTNSTIEQNTNNTTKQDTNATTEQNTNSTSKLSRPSDNISQNLVENNDISVSSSASDSLAFSDEPLTMNDAEKYFQSKILIPSNIPEGFDLTDISIPDSKLKCINLRYSSNSTFFQILQSKNLSKLEGTKVVSIENNKAYVSYFKDEKSNTTITKITWITNNIQYSLSGNLPDNSLINIAKSIK
jgi:hypothetical protein